MKSVLISIQPKWVEKIASGEKTIEVRKTRHKLSMKEFADMCGVCWQTIWNLEHNNYKPQRTTRCAIEMVLEEEVL